MELKDILDSNIISVGLEADSKEDALRKMSQMLLENKNIDNVDQFVEDIFEREKIGVTGIGNGVAIPHGKSDSVKQVGIAIAVLKTPIKWETLDGKDVKTIFLFCVSNENDAAHDHLFLLSKIAKKIADDEFLAKINSAKTVDEVLACVGGN
ncbi:PTS sugar transporter subunit IIA [Caproiciproducens faecalis]|uniref:PTS sugar transporter subunit IIA n=1 Tax=Caproiciproducens faecalis TaxID=2820301 RepID=A0ABS7DN06_9FIRM|nr:PTS sugar transporter subunit IIA [Caproiciproducens faecalis]MBW7572667.1 PTS sugar transporter subunit IIA [Caproiciproducens faecalis]